jgi:polyribonucleotide nucleotidyltransferase
MDAGVPIKKPVAGIAMGLLVEGDDYLVLSDIQGLEDHTGDMDFKVAGTADGITAMQMDIKVKGIPLKVMETALTQARIGRLFILDHLLKTLAKPRPELSPFAPKIEVIPVPTDRIGEIIGPGGRVIRGIIADTGAQVDIEEDGRCFISSQDSEAIAKARATIEGILKEVEPGEEYEGKVSRIETFGAFVEILPGKSGLVHVSQLSPTYVRDAHDVVKLDDIVKVRVTDIDNMGRINLTMLSPEQAEARKNERRERSDSRGNSRGGFSQNRGGRAPYRG